MLIRVIYSSKHLSAEAVRCLIHQAIEWCLCSGDDDDVAKITDLRFSFTQSYCTSSIVRLHHHKALTLERTNTSCVCFVLLARIERLMIPISSSASSSSYSQALLMASDVRWCNFTLLCKCSAKQHKRLSLHFPHFSYSHIHCSRACKTQNASRTIEFISPSSSRSLVSIYLFIVFLSKVLLMTVCQWRYRHCHRQRHCVFLSLYDETEPKQDRIDTVCNIVCTEWQWNNRPVCFCRVKLRIRKKWETKKTIYECMNWRMEVTVMLCCVVFARTMCSPIYVGREKVRPNTSSEARISTEQTHDTIRLFCVCSM